MKRLFPFILTAGLCVAYGQTSNITATITDPDGQTWNNGTFIVTFVPASYTAQPSKCNGSSSFTQQFRGSMNASGTFTVSVCDNGFVTPPGAIWQFTLCSNTSAPCQNTTQFVTGGNPNLSTQLSNQLVAPRFGPGQFAFGYADAEVITSLLQPGSIYFNVTSAAQRIWNGSSWTTGGGGGGSLPTATLAGQVPVSTGAGTTYIATATQANGSYNTFQAPPSFSGTNTTFTSGVPVAGWNYVTTQTTGASGGPFNIPFNFGMDINPAGVSNTTEAWTLNALAYTDPANTSNYPSELVGFHGEFDHAGSGLVSNGFGVSGENFIIGSGSENVMYGVNSTLGTWTGSTGGVNILNGYYTAPYRNGSGTITNAYAFHAATPTGSSGTLSNYTGLRIEDLTSTGTNVLAIDVAANDVHLGPAHTLMGIGEITGTANDSLPPLSFTAGGASNVPGFEVNGSAGSAAILYGVIDGTKISALDFNFGLTMVDQSGLGFASAGLSRNSGFFPLGASTVAIGNGTASDTTGILVGNHGVSLKATAALTAGQPVKLDVANFNQVVVTTTTDTGGGLAVGVVQNSPGAGSNAFIVTTGFLTTPILGTGTCTEGNFVIVDTTTNGRVKCTATYTAGTVIGVATQTQNTVGNTVNVLIGLR